MNPQTGGPRGHPLRARDLYDEAKKDGWVVISMKNDWKRIFGFDGAPQSDK